MGHDRMTTLSDTLTVGLVLMLLFGSIVLYLYTCIQQSEQKISLLESILLDLKMSHEMKSYTELPAEEAPVVVHDSPEVQESKEDYAPFLEEEETVDTGREEVALDIEELPTLDSEESTSPSYESMSLKELQGLAKLRGITGITKKAALVEALKQSEVKPGSQGTTGPNSFLETSAIVSHVDA